MKKHIYRLVSDYGFGDKAWLERSLSASEAVKSLNRVMGCKVVENIEQALDYNNPEYSIETDHEDDVEDWDWMDS